MREAVDRSADMRLIHSYLDAKEIVVRFGFAREIDWQDSIRFKDFTEGDFLREAAWVVLSSGMRTTVVQKVFPAFSAAFCGWRSAQMIVRHAARCRSRALCVFGHAKKVDAIISIARHVQGVGFPKVRRCILSRGIDYIRGFPFMGPATARHLAKNIGLDCVKPDRHLSRIAQRTGYGSPEQMCQVIAERVGDRLAVVDLVIWRYATIDTDYTVFDGVDRAGELPHARGQAMPRRTGAHVAA